MSQYSFSTIQVSIVRTNNSLFDLRLDSVNPKKWTPKDLAQVYHKKWDYSFFYKFKNQNNSIGILLNFPYNLSLNYFSWRTPINFRNLILYSVTALIWGSTWLVITFQLGVVDPLVSVIYRFILSAIILLFYCFATKLNLKFSLKEHLFIAFQGFFLFGINYWFVYKAEESLTSGLVSVVFSTIIFLNVINGSIFLKTPIRIRVIIGAIIGIIGIGLVFNDEIIHFNFSSENSMAFFIALIGVFWASFGNILSARNQKNNIPVIQTNAFGMIYGAIFMFVVSLFLQKEYNFDFSFSYISSMLYLSIFGSVIAFSTFLTLLGRIGADRAAYVTLIFPIIALMLSTIFEGYSWTLLAIIGVALILSGNFLVLQKKK